MNLFKILFQNTFKFSIKNLFLNSSVNGVTIFKKMLKILKHLLNYQFHFQQLQESLKY